MYGILLDTAIQIWLSKYHLADMPGGDTVLRINLAPRGLPHNGAATCRRHPQPEIKTKIY